MIAALKSMFDPKARPVALSVRANKYFVLTSVCLAVFTDLFLYGAIIPVMPFALDSNAGVSADKLQFWVSVLLALMGASLLVFSPIFGYLADRIHNRHLPFLAGALFLIPATLLLHLATSLPFYIAGRILQGLASAVVWIAGLALLVDAAGPGELGRFMGAASSAMAAAMLLAPIAGGALFSRAGYTGVFALCWALVGLDLIMRAVLVEPRVGRHWSAAESFTFVDAFSTSDAAKLVARDSAARARSASDSGSHHSLQAYTCPDARSPQAAGYALAAPSARSTLLVLLSQPRLLAALAGVFAHSAVLTALEATVPALVRTLFGWDALAAGLVLLPLAAPALLAPLIGTLADRAGPRYFAAAGLLALIPALVLLRLLTSASTACKAGLAALLLAAGCALATAQTPLMSEISAVVAALERDAPARFGPRGALGRAYALFNVAFAAGMLLGPLMAGLLKAAFGWAVMGWALALLPALAAVPVLLFVGGPIWRSFERAPRGKDVESLEDELDLEDDKDMVEVKF